MELKRRSFSITTTNNNNNNNNNKEITTIKMLNMMKNQIKYLNICMDDEEDDVKQKKHT